MKKNLTTLFLLFAFFTHLSAQQPMLKEMVAVVRPNYYEGTVKFLKSYSVSLARNGYLDASEVLKAYAEGGFGSGFVYKNSETGKFYVITNRHVLAQAKDVTVELYDAEDTRIKIENCPIVGIDKLLDLGIIELPASANVKNALVLSSKKVKDADEVFTAGFPGLGKDPSWQLGKGIVSNALLQNDELTNGSPTRIIQHTAQVDAGSSGGPLLLRNESMPGEFEVVGINTWKAEGRENVNFAIPSQAILRFIDEYVTNRKPLNITELQTSATDFAMAGKQSYTKLLPFISYRYIDNISVNDFYDLVNSASDKALEAIKENFRNGYPIEGVRIAIADAIVKKLNNKTIKFDSIGNSSHINQPLKVLFSENERKITSTWYGERGLWQISDFSLLQVKNLSKKGIATDFGYSILLKLGVDIPLKKMEGVRYKLSFGKTYYTFFVYDFNIDFGSTTLRNINYNYATNKADTTFKSKNTLGFDVTMGGQLPVNVGFMYLVPRLQGLLGIELGGERASNFYYGYYAGLEFAYKLKRKQYLFLGVGYKHKLIPKFFEGERVNSKGVPYIEIHAGISF